MGFRKLDKKLISMLHVYSCVVFNLNDFYILLFLTNNIS